MSTATAATRDPQSAPALHAVDVTKRFAVRRGHAPLTAVDQVSLVVPAGRTLGLIGESGSGKTTLARCILHLHPVDSGRIEIDGVDISALRGRALRRARASVQLVFQDPYAALDPRLSVAESISEPLYELIGLRGQRLTDRVGELLDEVSLGAGLAQRRPAELSGGQCQRVGIARALGVHPTLLVLDEPTSALDVSVQAQILNLLDQIQERHGVAYLFISHDLDVIQHMADETAVMYRGQIVERGATEAVFAGAEHPYVRELLGHDDSPNHGVSAEK